MPGEILNGKQNGEQDSFGEELSLAAALALSAQRLQASKLERPARVPGCSGASPGWPATCCQSPISKKRVEGDISGWAFPGLHFGGIGPAGEGTPGGAVQGASLVGGKPGPSSAVACPLPGPGCRGELVLPQGNHSPGQVGKRLGTWHAALYSHPENRVILEVFPHQE